MKILIVFLSVRSSIIFCKEVIFFQGRSMKFKFSDYLEIFDLKILIIAVSPNLYFQICLCLCDIPGVKVIQHGNRTVKRKNQQCNFFCQKDLLSCTILPAVKQFRNLNVLVSGTDFKRIQCYGTDNKTEINSLREALFIVYNKENTWSK